MHYATDFDLEMQKALEADGEKLFQLTGEDHGPYFFDDVTVMAPCPCCFESSGFNARIIPHTYWEPGWAEPDPTSPCGYCNGTGEVPSDETRPDDRDEDFYDEGYLVALDKQASA